MNSPGCPGASLQTEPHPVAKNWDVWDILQNVACFWMFYPKFMLVNLRNMTQNVVQEVGNEVYYIFCQASSDLSGNFLTTTMLVAIEHETLLLSSFVPGFLRSDSSRK